MRLDHRRQILNFGLLTMGDMEAKINAFWDNKLPIQEESRPLNVSMVKIMKKLPKESHVPAQI